VCAEVLSTQESFHEVVGALEYHNDLKHRRFPATGRERVIKRQSLTSIRFQCEAVNLIHVIIQPVNVS
jgi:hypothetical protein